jgi:hypothetical protein
MSRIVLGQTRELRRKVLARDGTQVPSGSVVTVVGSDDTYFNLLTTDGRRLLLNARTVHRHTRPLVTA